MNEAVIFGAVSFEFLAIGTITLWTVAAVLLLGVYPFLKSLLDYLLRLI